MFMVTNHHENFVKEEARREGLRRMYALHRKQQAEMVPGMLEFSHADYAIKIEEDRHGFLTCRIRDRANAKLLHRIRFKKKPRNGVVYNFLDGVRMSFLAFTPEKLAEIQLPL